MSDLLPVSVHILTWNSGHTLRKTLESVRRCREIIVLDGGSTDNTVTIAKEFGAHVEPQRDPSHQSTPLTDFSEARNRALKHATESWILALDSDELASPELLAEMERIVRMGQPCACLVPRRYVLPDGTMITHATTYPNARLYFFHRDTVERWIKPVHERPLLKPGTPIRNVRGWSLASLGSPEEFKRRNIHYLAIEVASAPLTWGTWLRRVIRAIRGRFIALLKLAWIWLLPLHGTRLPLRHEWLRFWYAWRLVVETRPWRRGSR